MMQNQIESVACARRATFKKAGSPDVRFEMHRTSTFQLEIVENGRRTGTYWRTLTPQEAMSGKTLYIGLTEGGTFVFRKDSQVTS